MAKKLQVKNDADKLPACVRTYGSKIYLDLIIAPGARRDKIAGIHGERLKICITAPPVDGKANAYLIKFLSEVLPCSKSRLTIVKGQSSKMKTVEIAEVEIGLVLKII